MIGTIMLFSLSHFYNLVIGYRMKVSCRVT